MGADCCCEVWRCRCAGNGQAVQLMGCGVIGAALVPVLVCCWQAVQVGGVICCGGGVPAWSSSGPRGHRAGPLLIRQAGQECSRRQGWKMGKRKRPGQAARCALLLRPLVCAGVVVLRRVHPGAGGGRWWSVPRFLCRSAAGTGTDPGATVPAASDPAARPALAVLHPVRFCPAAGGVRFSTLPGSALGVGLELSEL